MSSPIADAHLQNQAQPAINGGQQQQQQQQQQCSPATTTTEPYKHQPTPIRKPTRKPPPPDPLPGDDRSVSCNKCRPGSRDKISVNPIDITTTNNAAGAVPKSSTNPNNNNNNNNGLFRSILSSLTRKSPKSCPDTSCSSSSSSATKDELQWKLAMQDLSQKLVQANRKRDEALLESSRLKHSMEDLEKKLNKLEIYCRNLKSGLQVCSNSSPLHQFPSTALPNKQNQQNCSSSSDRTVVEAFLSSVSDARSSARLLSRSLALQLRQMGGGTSKVYDRVTALLQPYQVNGSSIKNARSLVCYLEALLNKALHEDFETAGFQKNSADRVLNPVQRCELNYSDYESLQGLTWEEVLNRGTRHFSEEFSGFCDRKMSEIVAMLGWNRAWPEPLLQAFFSAAKAVWLEHLLACSVHPRLQIFRVDKEVKFDGLYMEDMSGDRAQRLVADTVRIMVAPGFYVYNNVVKCKVLCSYSNNRNQQGSPTTTTTIAPSSTTTTTAKATTTTSTS